MWCPAALIIVYGCRILNLSTYEHIVHQRVHFSPTWLLAASAALWAAGAGPVSYSDRGYFVEVTIACLHLIVYAKPNSVYKLAGERETSLGLGLL